MSTEPAVAAGCTTIHEIISKSATDGPGSPALLTQEGRVITYAQLQGQVESTISQLNEAGIGRGDRVAMVLPNGPEMAAAFCAVACGAECAPLNPAYGKQEFEFFLDDLGAAALLVSAGADTPAIAVARERGIPVLTLSPSSSGRLFDIEAPGGGEPRSPGIAASEETALLLHTSGTTSRPKLVPLLHRNLCASAENISHTLQLTTRDRCLNVMPLFHIHGLVAAVLASLRAGASIVCTEGFHAVKFFRWIGDFEPTWYTAVPTMHQALLARAEQESEPPKRTLRFVRSSSASLPPKVMADIEKLFQAPVIEAYGMTEAAHQMASNPLPPAARKPGSVGPAGGPEIAILDESGNVLASGATGEVAIRGANVSPGYAANEDANRAAFNNGWFRTGDQGYFDDEGYLFLTGRLKEIINRGGEKISPREVDEMLLEHPAIQQAVTFAVAHEQLGEEIGAAVIVRAGKDLSERDVRDFAAVRLADFKVPRVVKLVDSIPKGPTGKLQRIGLADKLGIKPMSLPAKSSRSPAVAPSSDIERRLTELWAEVLAHGQFGVNDEFFAVGGTSLQATQLLAKLQEAELGLLPVLDFMDAPTVSGMAEHLAQATLAPPFTDGLVLLQPKGTAPPLFCAGPHNGSLLGLAGIARHLGANQPLIGIDPRLADGDTRLTVEAVAERAIQRLRAYQPSGPYYLLGMCFGAKILFEAACQLQQQGEKVGFLGLINAFHVRQTSGSERFLKGVQNLVRRAVFHSRRLGGLPPAEMFGYAAERARGVFEDAVVARLYRIARRLSDRAAAPFCTRRVQTVLLVDSWEPRPFSGPVTIIADSVPRARIHPSSKMGWGGLVPADSDTFIVPDNHPDFWSEVATRFVAEKVAERLAAN